MSRWFDRLRQSENAASSCFEQFEHSEHAPQHENPQSEPSASLRIEHSEQIEQEAGIRTAFTDAQAERTAIMRHEGGMSVAWAEAWARFEGAESPEKLDTMRWLEYRLDGVRLWDAWGNVAETLGWPPAAFVMLVRHIKGWDILALCERSLTPPKIIGADA